VQLYSMGFYSSQEAAALAWDITAASLRRCTRLNFPEVSFAELEQQLDALKCVMTAPMAIGAPAYVPVAADGVDRAGYELAAPVASNYPSAGGPTASDGQAHIAPAQPGSGGGDSGSATHACSAPVGFSVAQDPFANAGAPVAGDAAPMAVGEHPPAVAA
jgi:hypothetical protein